MRSSRGGSIVAVVATLVGILSTALVASAADGDADNGWGTGGIAVATPINGGSGITYSTARSFRIGPDGKVTAVGVWYGDPALTGGSARMVVARFLPNGQLDTTCDGDGVWMDPVTNIFSIANDLEILSDGSFVVVGSQLASNGVFPDIVTRRFDSQCNPDATYGTGGKVVHSIGVGSEPAAITLQSDGKIVIAGWEFFNVADNDDTRLLAFRIDTNGQIDPSFSPSGSGFYRDPDRPSQARAIVHTSDGGFRIAGFTRPGVNDLGLVVALDTNGSLVPSFGSNGRRIIAQADDLVYNGIDQRGDGRLVVAGRLTTSGSDRLVIQCLLADGSSDTACGASGVRTHSDLGSMEGSDIRATGDERLVVVGRFADSLTPNSGGFVGRFSADGSVDTSFASTGYHLGTVGGRLFRVRLQSDGKIVGSGEFNPAGNLEFTVIRLDNTVITTPTTPTSTTSPTAPADTAPPTSPTTLLPTSTIAIEQLPATGRDQSDLVALALMVAGALLVVSTRRRVV